MVLGSSPVAVISLFSSKIFPYQETRRKAGPRVSISIVPKFSVKWTIMGGWVNQSDTKKLNLKYRLWENTNIPDAVN